MSAVEMAAGEDSKSEEAKCLAGNSNEAEEEDSLGKPCCRIPWRGCLALLGGFLIQLTLGSFYSFGNMMTYMTSYMR